jgi:hypothetical protein
MPSRIDDTITRGVSFERMKSEANRPARPRG